MGGSSAFAGHKVGTVLLGSGDAPVRNDGVFADHAFRQDVSGSVEDHEIAGPVASGHDARVSTLAGGPIVGIASVRKTLGHERSVLAGGGAFAIACSLFGTEQVASASLVVEINVGWIDAIIVRGAVPLVFAGTRGTVHFISRKGRSGSGGGDVALAVAIVVGGAKNTDIDSRCVLGDSLVAANNTGVAASSGQGLGQGLAPIAVLGAHARFAKDGPHTGRKDKIVPGHEAIRQRFTKTTGEATSVSAAVLSIGTVRGGFTRGSHRRSFRGAFLGAHARCVAVLCSDTPDFRKHVLLLETVLVRGTGSDISTNLARGAVHPVVETLALSGARKFNVQSAALHAAAAVPAVEGSNAGGDGVPLVFRDKAIAAGSTSPNLFARSIGGAVATLRTVFVSDTAGLIF